MPEYFRWPYDEVSAEMGVDGKSVVIIAPWLNATVGVSEANVEKIRNLAQKLKAQSLVPDDMPLLNWFFGKLADYPLCYLLPTKKSGGQLDEHELVDPVLALDSPESLIASALGNSVELTSTAKSLGRSVFEWDWDSAATFSTTAAGIHPESLFSVARRFHLIDVLATNRGSEVFDEIRQLPLNEFKKAAGLMVRQNHFVTQKCRESLTPALGIAGRARPLVEKFLKEENGHDRILGLAMQSFAADPDTVPVAAQTKLLMQMLEFTAKHNLLAFAMAVDCFERSAYQKTDPLAQLLRQGGFEMAAKQVNRHMEINDHGAHENVALGFLEAMAPCSNAYAKEALRLAEVISLLASGVAVAALELYRDSRTH